MFAYLFSIAAIAITKRLVKPTVPGAGRRTVTEVTLNGEYLTGGLACTPKNLGLRRVTDADITVKGGSEAEAVAVGSCWYDTTNQKIVVNDYKTQKELANGKDVSKVVVIVRASGS